MRLDLFIHVLGDPKTGETIIKQGELIMATLQEVLDDVRSEKTVIASVLTLIDGLKQQLADALAGELSAEKQAQVDAIFAAAEENKSALSAAINANTPVPPTV